MRCESAAAQAVVTSSIMAASGCLMEASMTARLSSLQNAEVRSQNAEVKPAPVRLQFCILTSCFCIPAILLLVGLLAAPATAKNKKTATLPEYVLRARTAAVVIDPDAGEPLDNPRANENARDSVEKALMQWGRYDLVQEGQEPDLIIVVRAGTGKLVAPTIRGGPIDNRPGVIQSSGDTTRVGGQRGQAPPLTDPDMNPPNQGPHVSNEGGAVDDSFAVYRGNLPHPLDSSPVWRYIAKDCLQPPTVAAVDEFRKAVVASEKPQPAPPQKGP
jgi:hypothetical protein